MLNTLNIEPLFELLLRVAQSYELGQSRGSHLHVDQVTGEFKGAALSGSVTWGVDQLRGSDGGCFRPEASLILQPLAAGPILMRYRGIAVVPQQMLTALMSGMAPSDAYYHRIAIEFETEDRNLDWLNRVLGIGAGQLMRHSDGVLGVRYSVGVVR